ncbi:unnamed protein product, partial [Hymenolepis diminuta]
MVSCGKMKRLLNQIPLLLPLCHHSNHLSSKLLRLGDSFQISVDGLGVNDKCYPFRLGDYLVHIFSLSNFYISYIVS